MHLGLDDSTAAAGVCLPQHEALPTLVRLRNGCVFTGNTAQQQGGAVAVQSGVLVAQARTRPNPDRNPNADPALGPIPISTMTANSARSSTPALPHILSVTCSLAECQPCSPRGKCGAVQRRAHSQRMPCAQRKTVCTQGVQFAENNATSGDGTSGSGGALFVVPDCSGGFGCKNASANVTDFSMIGNAAGQVRLPR